MTLTIEGASWLPSWSIQDLLPEKHVNLVVDSPDSLPNKETQLNVFTTVEPPSIRPDVHARLSDPEWCRQWDLILTPNINVVANKEIAIKYVYAPFGSILQGCVISTNALELAQS